MDSRIWKWALVIVVGGGIGIWRSLSNRSSDSDEVLQVALKIVHEWDCYADNKTLIDQCADRAHKAAFTKAYTTRGRRRSADIDPKNTSPASSRPCQTSSNSSAATTSKNASATARPS